MREVTTRIAYVSGPIDAAKVYDDWKASSQSDYYGTIYLAQLYKILEDANASGLIITTNPGASGSAVRGNISVRNLAMPQGCRGILYHAAMLLWVARCLIAIVRFRTDAAVLTAGQDYFWAFRPLKWFGTRLIASLHCTLWPRYAVRKRHQLWLTSLNGRFFYPACDFIQGVSEEAVRQIRETAPRLQIQPVRFFATYSRSRFANVQKPSWPKEDTQFRLLFVGRLTRNKGVFDMIEIMGKLEKKQPGRFTLDVCGAGPARSDMVSTIEEKNLESMITMHGQSSTEELQRLYGSCHAVLVPTRSDFEEGTPKVAFEAVLNFRPIVMSAACPALADVDQATIEAKVDDVADYVSAIETLARDADLYRAKVAGAEVCRIKHFDGNNSYGSKLTPAILAVATRRSR
ncbi:glycosyltransferase family 4 protein [Parafrankia sp. BMG5.11]|uniref:glycosyltransferase family 4 protein n=1 Tax=Parafrankia sp. BMG5.11 TaxID=222540 RepID=UPI001038DCA7|nr:glycosyltransferase family 4 protein [Parafrankia sp. BMG5.11]TCJ34964.1 glycosyltransferase [Parafrankia sp. BMG5.11]